MSNLDNGAELTAWAKENRRSGPPRRETDRVMALEVHQYYTTRTAMTTSDEIRALWTKVDQHNEKYAERLNGLGEEIRKGISLIQSEINLRVGGDIKSGRDATGVLTKDVALLQERLLAKEGDYQTRKGREWTLILGVLIALASALINVFWMK